MWRSWRVPSELRSGWMIYKESTSTMGPKCNKALGDRLPPLLHQQFPELTISPASLSFLLTLGMPLCPGAIFAGGHGGKHRRNWHAASVDGIPTLTATSLTTPLPFLKRVAGNPMHSLAGTGSQQENSPQSREMYALQILYKFMGLHFLPFAGCLDGRDGRTGYRVDSALLV